MDGPVQASWNTYWLIWFVVTFPIGFLVPEVVALCTDWRRTLSATVWDLEDFVTGQPVSQWSASHLLFVGIMLTLFVWLAGHFALGYWR